MEDPHIMPDTRPSVSEQEEDLIRGHCPTQDTFSITSLPQPSTSILQFLTSLLLCPCPRLSGMATLRLVRATLSTALVTVSTEVEPPTLTAGNRTTVTMTATRGETAETETGTGIETEIETETETGEEIETTAETGATAETETETTTGADPGDEFKNIVYC